MLRFLNISHQLGERTLFQDLSWHIKPGDRVGLFGDNGTGKTTLLRMAAGELTPTTGQIVPRKNMTLGWLKQEIHAAEGEGTVLDSVMQAFEREILMEKEIHNLYDELTRTSEEQHAAILDQIHCFENHLYYHDQAIAEAESHRVLEGLGFNLDMRLRPLSQYSGGWQMRAHIARLLLERPDLLMLDEPTNHLDLESIEWLEGFLSTFTGALVIVSHDLYFLDRMTKRTAWLNQKKIRVYEGAYSKFLQMRELEEQQMIRDYEAQQREVEHIEKFIERFRYKATKAAAVQSRIKMLGKMERLELPPSLGKKVHLRLPTPAPCNQRMIELRNVSISYDNTNDVLSNISLYVEANDKIALVGRNGAGKSTLLKVLGGFLDHQGYRSVDPRVQIEYFSQNRVDELNTEGTVITEARPPGSPLTEEQMRSFLGSFLFSGDNVFKPISVLSGGEKSRVALARMMLRQGNLLLLDEPTNHLDMATREVLKNALAEYTGAIVMISHDRHFIDGVANRVIEVANKTIENYPGNYSYFLYKKQQKAASPNEADTDAHLIGRAVQTQSESSKNAAAQQQNQSRQERLRQRSDLRAEIKRLEQQIEQNEIRLSEIHFLQSDTQAWTDGRVTGEICAEAKQLEDDIAYAMEQWEKVQTQLAELV